MKKEKIDVGLVVGGIDIKVFCQICFSDFFITDCNFMIFVW